MASNAFDISLVDFKNYISNDLLDQEDYAQPDTIILKLFYDVLLGNCRLVKTFDAHEQNDVAFHKLA